VLIVEPIAVFVFGVSLTHVAIYVMKFDVCKSTCVSRL